MCADACNPNIRFLGRRLHGVKIAMFLRFQVPVLETKVQVHPKIRNITMYHYVCPQHVRYAPQVFHYICAKLGLFSHAQKRTAHGALF